MKTDLVVKNNTNSLTIINLTESLKEVSEIVESSKSQNTLKNYEVAKKQFDDFIQLNNLGADLNSVALFSNELKKQGKSLNTIMIKIIALKYYYADKIDFNHKVFKEFLKGLKNKIHVESTENKTKVVNPKKELSSNICDSFIDAIKSKYHNEIIELSQLTKNKRNANLMHCKKLTMLRSIALIRLGYALATRQSELLNIKLKDITFGTNTVDFDIYQVKTQKQIVKSLEHDTLAIQALNNLLKEVDLKSDDYIFQGINQHGKYTGVQMDYKTFYNFIKATAGALELDNVATHSLRRGFATDAIKLDIPIFDLMRHIGHDAIASTQRYVGDSGTNSLKVTKRVKC